MKSRLLDVMGDALTLVRKSNLTEATALIRDALSGREAQRGTPTYPAGARPPSGRGPLGDVLQALRAGRAHMPKLTPEEEPRRPPDAKLTSRSYSGAAGVLNYRLYVPSDPARRGALILMLHGCTQDPDDFAVGTRMNALADEFGFIVAYPHQPRSANAQGCWNWFDKRHQHRGSGEPAKLAGLAKSLDSEFGVPRERTFVAGLSAGGAMAEVLAATYPDVFEAVGVHSGLPYGAANNVMSALAAMKGTAAPPAPPDASEMSVRKIVFHGGADATVHPANGERIHDQSRLAAKSLKDVDLEWEVEGRRVGRKILEDAEGHPVHEHWFVEGGEHAWFGGDPSGTYTQSVGLDASRLMARFFLED